MLHTEGGGGELEMDPGVMEMRSSWALVAWFVERISVVFLLTKESCCPTLGSMKRVPQDADELVAGRERGE